MAAPDRRTRPSFGADLGVPKIVVPATSMAHSAYGALASDIHQSAERSLLMRGGGGDRDPWDGLDAAAIGAVFDELEALCRERIEAAGIAPDKAEIVRTVDMRYRRQTHDLIVRFAPGPVTAEASARRRPAASRRTYEALYGKGSGFRQAGIELTTFRVEAIGQTKQAGAELAERERTPQSRVGAGASSIRSMRDDWIETADLAWLALPVGHRGAGAGDDRAPRNHGLCRRAAGGASSTQAGNLTIDLSEARS